MKQFTDELSVQTHGSGLYEITDAVAEKINASEIKNGLLTLFIRHTSASLVIQENADPDVQHDLNEFFKRLVPENEPYFLHTAEGADDMPAHIKSALTSTSLSIPIQNGRPVLGTWQGIYVFEHRARTHNRKLVLSIIGE